MPAGQIFLPQLDPWKYWQQVPRFGCISVKALPALQQTMNRLLYCFSGISTPILKWLNPNAFSSTDFGKCHLEWCWKPCCIQDVSHLPLFIHLADPIFLQMTQFIPDKSTGSIFISLLCSTGLLMNRSTLLWAIDCLAILSSFFLPRGSFPSCGSLSQVILARHS